MNEKNQLDRLYRKFLNNQCDQEEWEFLMAHFKTGRKDALEKMVAKALSESENISPLAPMDRAKLARSYEQIKSRINAEPSPPILRKPRRALYSRLAAAAAFVLITSIAWYFVNQGRSDEALSAQSKFGDDVAPGTDKAILTLSDGRQLPLDKGYDETLAEDHGVAISLLENGQLAYQSEPSSGRGTELKYNRVETPRGGAYNVTLPDGTRIWLNAASSIRYPTRFAMNERTVELQGEAYFEVAEDASRPFKVICRDQTVTVLGTHFNINSYAAEAVTRTTLIEGSVQVESGSHAAMLRPGQQAVSAESLQVLQVDPQEVIAWKNGRTQFSDASIQEIMRMLSRWYDVEVEYQGEMVKTGFGGSVSRTKNISEILTLLELTGDVHFKIEGRRVIVMP